MVSEAGKGQMHVINRNSSKDELTKCSLWRKSQRTEAWYSSKGTRKYKTRHKPFSFSTVPQFFLWHQKQTTSEPTKSCDHSLYICFFTHLWSSLLLQLIQILRQVTSFFSLKIFHHLFIKKSRAPICFLNYCYCIFEAISNTWVIITNN